MTPEHRATVERMRTSAGSVRRAVEGVPPDRLRPAPRAGEWSALETLTHVRDVVVHVYGTRIRRLLYEDAPVFADFDEETYRRTSLARGETVQELVDTIVAEHEQLARLVHTLADADWARAGRHPAFGAMSTTPPRTSSAYRPRCWRSTRRTTSGTRRSSACSSARSSG